jgi:hypothetical protein
MLSNPQGWPATGPAILLRLSCYLVAVKVTDFVVVKVVPG